MIEANKDIREARKKAGIPSWRLAELAGYSENTLYRRLRHELPAEEKTRLLELIEKEATHHE